MTRNILETEQKALEINLDDKVYGAFAEIGAGQEVARFFFQVGAAAGTIAKSMSAYDKQVSDDIYGAEERGKGRYVCEPRLYRMLDHEYELMEKRLRTVRPDQTFFAFADTVSAINFTRTIKGDGWLGLRFQLSPDRPPNDLIIHVHMLDNNNRLQQQAVGVLGVNMIYGCYRYASDPETLLVSLLDGLRGRVMLDMVRLEGPDFVGVDNRLLCLWAVKHGLSDVTIFSPDQRSIHAGEFLYKKSILIARGSFRPPTLVQEDMIEHAYEQFRQEPDVQADNTWFLAEITIENLRAEGVLDERDFLDRADLLCALGRTVIVSGCVQHKKLIAYFGNYKVQRIGLAMGARKLRNILRENVEQNPDNVLDALGEIFLRNVRFYVYPAKLIDQEALMTAQNLEVPEEIHFIYQYLLHKGHIVDIKNYNPEILHIYHKHVLQSIREGSQIWTTQVPETVSKLIQENHLFHYPN